MVDGLRRAFENMPDSYRQINKIAKKYMRDYVPSIFLLKKAERKIKEMEIQSRKGPETNNKRLSEAI